MNILKNILLGLLLLFTVFFICRCLMALGAVIFDSHIRFRAQQREAFLRPQRDRRYMPLSVLVMAGTEPQALLATLDSLQKQAYPLYEIIVPEDCMKDPDVQALTEQLELLPLPQPVRRQLKCTPETAIYESGKLPLRLVRRPKTCLGDAWNLGINIARYPYFACIRAGMQLDTYGLDTLMGPFFQHRDTMATGGSIQKASSARPSSLTTLENLEYDRSIPAMQVLLHSKTLLLFGGPSAYRKDTVIEVGGFPARDDGLDPGLTLTLQRHCRKKGQSCRIVYVPEAKGVLPPQRHFPAGAHPPPQLAGRHEACHEGQCRAAVPVPVWRRDTSISSISGIFPLDTASINGWSPDCAYLSVPGAAGQWTSTANCDTKFSIQASFVPVRFPKPHGKGFPLSKISPSRSSALAAGKHPVPAPNHHSPHSRAIRLKKSAAEKPRRLNL